MVRRNEAGHYEQPIVDAVLLRRVARGYAWWDEIRSGKATLKEIVKREKLSRRFVAIHLDLAFLSPDLVTSVLEGTQPPHFSAQVLRSIQIPPNWRDQRSLLDSLSVEPKPLSHGPTRRTLSSVQETA